MSVLSNDSGKNSSKPDCSIVCTTGTLGSNNTGSLGIYPGDFKANGVSVVNALKNANNENNLFFNVCRGYGGTNVYGDGAGIMAVFCSV